MRACRLICAFVLGCDPSYSKSIDTFNGCPAEGRGGHADPDLNLMKNRISVPNSTKAWKISDVLAIKTTAPKEQRVQWTDDEQRAVAYYEAKPISVVGFLAGAKEEGPETCNCEIDDHKDHDFHIYLVDTADTAKSDAVIVEMTPRVRQYHNGWTINALKHIVKSSTRVRVSGWLMFDEEHPEGIGKWRGTLWEIHPITKFEVSTGYTWTEL